MGIKSEDQTRKKESTDSESKKAESKKTESALDLQGFSDAEVYDEIEPV
jgi:hypothetical protein